MCGIAGVYHFNNLLSGPEDACAVVDRMLATIVHRGPDAAGMWADPSARCVLGHRRLSIIDTSDGGRQPMVGQDGRWIITFNGEIYNFQKLRRELEAAGTIFHGRTDTEVLLAGIAKWGVEVLPRLDGMFAFAAFDTVSGDLLLARDPFGEKPLYFTELGGGAFAFASELQALETLPGFDSEVSLDAMAEVLMFQYIGAPRSIYRHVEKLLPGHWMRVSGKQRVSARYFEFNPGAGDLRLHSEDDLVDELEELLVTNLRRRLISDVPLGAFLSGGVDSSTVCALIRRRLNEPLKTFSMGFLNSGESEHETARLFSTHLGTEHHEQVLTPDSLAFLETIGAVLDEPNADSSCLPTFLLSKFARTQVTVAISGDGGDELFAGYGRYFTTLEEFPEGWAGRSQAPGEAYYSERILVSQGPHIQALFGEVPQKLATHLARLRGNITNAAVPLHGALRKTDIENYLPGAVLPKVDRMSMRHSLEVRTPFLNVDLARFAEKLPQSSLYSKGVGKLLLRRLACRYLPPELIMAPKRGFSIPTTQWAPEELLNLSEKLLQGNDSRLQAVFGEKRIRDFVGSAEQLTGAAVYRVWGLVMLESWCRHHRVVMPSVPLQRQHSRKSVVTMPTLYAIEVAPNAYASVLKASETEPSFAWREIEAAIQNGTDILCLALSRSIANRKGDSNGHCSPSTLRRIVLRLGNVPPGWLKDVTLMIVDNASVPMLGAHTLHQIRKAGVCELIALDPYRSDGQVLRVHIRRRRSFVTDYVSVMRRRADAVRAGNLTIEASKAPGHSFSLMCPHHECHPGKNLYSIFSVYVGNVQLPPLPFRTEMIETEGDGRYCIFDSTIIASSPKDVACTRYMVVPASKSRDSFYTEILPAPLPAMVGLDDVTSIDSSRRMPGGETVFEGKGRGLVLLVGALIDTADSDWITGLTKQFRKMSEPVWILSILPVQPRVVAELLAVPMLNDAKYDCLAQQDVVRWIAYLPNSDNCRDLLWPRWNRFGKELAGLVAFVRHVSPRLVLASDRSSAQFLKALKQPELAESLR